MGDFSEYICIVGAGIVSNYMAVELLDRGHKVLVIEAGGLDFESSLLSRKDYNFITPSMLPENVHRVGGGGNYWIGRIGEFLPNDFETLPEIRHESWPFKKSELDPYYRSVYSRLLGSDLLDDEFLAKCVYIDVPKNLAVRPIRYTKARLIRNNFLQRVTDSNLILLQNTLVYEIGFDEDEILPKISIKNSLGEVSDLLVKNLIIAGGALQSTKLFLVSEKLHNQLNIYSAGAFLMEHLDGYVGEIRVSRRNLDFVKRIALDSDRLIESSDNLKYGLSILIEPTQNRHITVGFEIVKKVVHFKFAPAVNGLNPGKIKCYQKIAFLLERVFRKLIGLFNNLFLEKIFGFHTFSIWLKAEELPFEKSNLDVDKGRGILNYRHKISDDTSRAVREVLKSFQLIFMTQNLGTVKFYNGIMDESRTIQLRPNWHPMGTLRMGNPGDSVVDQNLKLHGFSNIYFLSSAVFPTGSNQNPVFTTLALGARLADYLSKGP